jgi:hypothetical protein
VWGAVEEMLGRVASDHAVGDGVGVAFVGVTRLADATFELNTTALLNDVCRLMGNCMKIGATTKRDVVAKRVRIGPDRSRGGSSVRSRVSLNR